MLLFDFIGRAVKNLGKNRQNHDRFFKKKTLKKSRPSPG